MTAASEAQEAFAAFAGQLYRLLRPGDQRVVATVAIVGRRSRHWIQVFSPDGAESSAEGTYRIVEPTADNAAAVARLREVTYTPQRGAWFTAQVRITPDKQASIRTWLDDEPRLDDVSSEDWLDDLERYPRTPDHTPAWLAGRVAAARAAREEAGEWSTSLTLDVPDAVAADPATDAGALADEGDGDEPEFVRIVRAAVESEPDNLQLRVELIELLIERSPRQALAEIDALAERGANAQTVEVLRARAAAATASRAPSPPTAIASPASEASVLENRDSEKIAARASDADDATPVWDVERPAVTLDDVAGLVEVKRHLEASFLAPMRNPELARMFGKQPRGSLLMYGPPGCGKTFIARAVAGELGANFVHATLADLLGQYIGDSEKAVHALFETARAAKPCVIFIDEFDAIGGRRTSGNAYAQGLRMITSQLLEEFDGVSASNDGIYVLAATNRPWDVDPALRRPGRLDRTVLILPPDLPAREAIVQIGLRDKPAADIDASEIARRTEEFSGADLSYVVETAVEQAFMDSLQAGVPRMITTYDLEAAASRTVPSTRTWFEQVKPVIEYGIDDGTFGQLRAYLKQHRI
ncbi:ATP-binding protein [Microbacterium sp. RD1]|uniref:ATP-binding protein n=1 Tax=Microbacterium sp. RD1 TaxID=3457313 RepID=UPI003FA5EDFB